jgi:prepilin peptidase CpaA
MQMQSILWFLPFVVPIAIWVAWSDMKFMKIPNKAVVALLAVYLVVGFFIFPLEVYSWGWVLFGIVLIAGIFANAVGFLGAGDAKFAAAMAPFFVTTDIRLALGLFAACLLAGFASHRLMRATPAFRAATPDWESWTHTKFPMGLALSGTLVFNILLAAQLG